MDLMTWAKSTSLRISRTVTLRSLFRDLTKVALSGPKLLLLVKKQ